MACKQYFAVSRRLVCTVLLLLLSLLPQQVQAQTQWRLNASDGEIGTHLGQWLILHPNIQSVAISDDNNRVMACAPEWQSNEGQCYMWSLSPTSGGDWNTPITETILQAPITGGLLGNSGPFISPDGSMAIACAPKAIGWIGQCILWLETTPGLSRDWQDTPLVLSPATDTVSNTLGWNGLVISEDLQHIVVSATVYNSYQGKLCVFSESSLGNRDWDTQIIELYAADGGSSDRLGWGYGPRISVDNEYIVACAPYTLGLEGLLDSGNCYVFAGAGSWSTQYNIYPRNPGANDRFGETSIAISNNNKHILTCSDKAHNYEGACYLYTDVLGVQDWNASVTVLRPTNPVNLASLSNDGGAKFSTDVDNTHILVCSARENLDQGACYIWSETIAGSEDWQNNEFRIAGPDGTTDRFGAGGYSLSADNQHLVICAYKFNGDQGKCYGYTETVPGARDWTHQAEFVALDGQIDDTFGAAILSADSSLMVACSMNANAHRGACYVIVPDFEDQCLAGSCSVHSVCVDAQFDYSCICDAGYTGSLCETNIDDCTSNPCDALGASLCNDLTETFNCTCNDGFDGVLCENNIDECASTPCMNAGTCTDLVDGILCDCVTGTSGVLCEEVVICASTPCVGDSTCVESGVLEFQCACSVGYTGELCDEDIDDCVSGPCAMNGSCMDDGTMPNNFTCICDDGFTGATCTGDVDDCASNPCPLPGSVNCTDTGANSFNCSCQGNYTGRYCDVVPVPPIILIEEPVIDPCLDIPCANNANCTIINDTSIPAEDRFLCTCLPESYTAGTLCAVQLAGDKGYAIIVMTLDPNDPTVLTNTTTGTGDYILAALLALQPNSIKEQYDITVVLQTNGFYEATIIVYGTLDTEPAEIVTALENDDDTDWYIGSVELVGIQIIDDPTVDDDDTSEAQDPMLFIIVMALAVMCLLLLVACICCRYKRANDKHIRKVITTKEPGYQMPV